MNDHGSPLLDRALDGGLLLLLAVSTVVFGGRFGWGLVATVGLFALLLCVWAARVAAAGELVFMRTPLDWPILGFAGLLLVQMFLGFPWGWSGSGVVEWATQQATERAGRLPFIPGTLDYHASRQALVLFAVYAGTYYLTLSTVRSRPQFNRRLTAVAAIGYSAALYGLIEFLSGSHGVFGWKEGGNRLLGTFVNPDTFATYLGLLIPLSVATLIAVGARRRRRHRSHKTEPDTTSSSESTNPPIHQSTPSSPDTDSAIRNSQSEIHDSPEVSVFDRSRQSRPYETESRKIILTLACILGIAALAFTISRGGLIGFLVGGLLFVAMLWMREPGHRRRLTGIGMGLSAGLLVMWIGAEPIFRRFGMIDMDSESRLTIYRDTLRMIGDFPLLGTGFGTFGEAYLRYVAPEFTFGKITSHAHNEWLQLAAEGGLVAFLLLLLALALYLRPFAVHLFGIGAGESGSQIRNSQFAIRNSDLRHDPYNIALAFGCLASLAVAGVDSLFDFPFRTPANAILLAMILAIGMASVGMRLHTESVECFLPTRIVVLRGTRRICFLAGVGCLAVFLTWTAAAGLLAEQAGEKGEQVIGGASGPGARGDRPWVVETAKNREAQAHLTWAVALDPLNPAAHTRLGRLHEQLTLRAWGAGLSPDGRFLAGLPDRSRAALASADAAVREFATAARLAPAAAEAWGRLGWTLGVRARIAPFDPDAAPRAAQDAEHARAGLRQAVAMNPNNRYRHELLAAYGFQRLEVDRPAGGLADPVVKEGVEAQRRAIELDPTYLPTALDRLLRYTRDVAQLQAALPADSVDALYAAHLLEEQEFWSEAKAFYQHAIGLAPDDAKPLYYREYAEALTARGEDPEAKEILEVVLRFDPQNLDLRLAQAGVLVRLKRPAEALQAYQEALDSAAAVAGNIPPSRAPTRWAVKLPPAHPTREERALAEIRARFPKEERTADPLTRALTGLAGYHHAQGRDDLAVPLWEKAIARSPDDAPTAFGLAKSYDAVGAWVTAVDFYKKAIELHKGNLEYRLTLADRFYDNEQTFQAINLWREVLAARPTLLAPRLKLAGAYIRLEQYPEALREYERVLQLEPNNSAAKAGITRLRGRLVS